MDDVADLSVIFFNKPIPINGSITRWKFWPARTESLKGLVWRLVGNNIFAVIGINEIPASFHLNTKVTYTVPIDQRIDVEVGDYIGFYFNNAAIRFSNVNNDHVSWSRLDEMDIGSTIDTESIGQRSYSIQAVVTGEYLL